MQRFVPHCTNLSAKSLPKKWLVLLVARLKCGTHLMPVCYSSPGLAGWEWIEVKQNCLVRMCVSPGAAAALAAQFPLLLLLLPPPLWLTCMSTIMKFVNFFYWLCQREFDNKERRAGCLLNTHEHFRRACKFGGVCIEVINDRGKIRVGSSTMDSIRLMESVSRRQISSFNSLKQRGVIFYKVCQTMSEKEKFENVSIKLGLSRKST